jgi:ubiquinone/menaquinone biosynthesis C-methylase UbiE
MKNNSSNIESHLRDNIDYHLRELEIARDATSLHHQLPALRNGERRVLDVGCGIGQSLIALDDAIARKLVGIDVNRSALDYGKRHFTNIAYVEATAEALPFTDGAFDFVISRVTLPYTVFERSFSEIARILAEDGRIWVTLFRPSEVLSYLRNAIVKLAFKDVVFQLYALANGVVFHCFAKQFRLPFNGACESFQTRSSMRRVLGRYGFRDIEFEVKGRAFLCSARKRGGAAQEEAISAQRSQALQ